MRIAIFAETYYPFISGVVTHIETLKNGLEAAGHQVLIVTLNPKAEKHYIEDGILYCPAVPLKKIYGYGVANPLNLKRLRILRKWNPDILHVQTEFSMGIFGLYAGKHLQKPVVYTLHTMYDDYVFYLFPEKMGSVARVAQPAAHAYIRNVARKAVEIIGPSKKVADYLRLCGVRRQINIIPNTVDISEFLPENVDEKKVACVQKELGIRQDDIALCFVGRLGREKSIDVMIEYFLDQFKGDERFKFFIIGAGPEEEELRQQIKTSNGEKQVFLLGRIDHDKLPIYYRACNLFCTASLSEMNSISLLEATASGLYAVNRLDKINRDQIESGVNGDVFETAQQFGEIVRTYAALSPQEQAQKRESVTAYAKRYGPEQFTQKVLEVYGKAIVEYIPGITKY